MLVVNPDMDVAAADLSSNLVELLKQVHADNDNDNNQW